MSLPTGTYSALFDPEGFLEIARSLAHKTNATEAELRTAVGRAYYGVFLQAREALAATGEITPTGTRDDHKIVVKALRNRRGPSGNQLRKLRGARNQDDYHLRRTRTQASAQQMVMTADLISSRL